MLSSISGHHFAGHLYPPRITIPGTLYDTLNIFGVSMSAPNSSVSLPTNYGSLGLFSPTVSGTANITNGVQNVNPPYITLSPSGSWMGGYIQHNVYPNITPNTTDAYYLICWVNISTYAATSELLMTYLSPPSFGPVQGSQLTLNSNGSLTATLTTATKTSTMTTAAGALPKNRWCMVALAPIMSATVASYISVNDVTVATSLHGTDTAFFTSYQLKAFMAPTFGTKFNQIMIFQANNTPPSFFANSRSSYGV